MYFNIDPCLGLYIFSTFIIACPLPRLHDPVLILSFFISDRHGQSFI